MRVSFVIKKGGEKLINLYDSRETNFNNNGIVVLSDVISSHISEELNGSFECELEYSLDEHGEWQHLLGGNIIKADGHSLVYIINLKL